MKAKLNRGPMHGKYYMIEDWRWKIEVMEPVKITYKDVFLTTAYPQLEPMARRGEYHKSNRVLKNGAVVFEWMGWTDGKK